MIRTPLPDNGANDAIALLELDVDDADMLNFIVPLEALYVTVCVMVIVPVYELPPTVPEMVNVAVLLTVALVPTVNESDAEVMNGDLYL